MRTNLLNWSNLVSISKNVVFYAFGVVRIYKSLISHSRFTWLSSKYPSTLLKEKQYKSLQQKDSHYIVFSGMISNQSNEIRFLSSLRIDAWI